jgi:transcriptional regulator with GAF, ATPase, and Fis domain
VQQLSRRLGKTIDAIAPEAMNALTKYPWPGNIRELQNVIERAVILTKGTLLNVAVDDLRVPNGHSNPLAVAPSGDLPSPSRNMRESLDDAERQQIIAALEQANWTVAGPNGAALLGMKRSTLQSRMQKLAIRISRRGA